MDGIDLGVYTNFENVFLGLQYRGPVGSLESMIEVAGVGGAPELHRTPTGWLAVGNDYPRIGVMADTEDEVIRKFADSRKAWFAPGNEGADPWEAGVQGDVGESPSSA